MSLGVFKRPKTVEVLYHAGCRDGYASAMVVEWYFKEFDNKADKNVVHFHAVEPGQIINKLIKLFEYKPYWDMRIYCLDLSFTKEAYTLLKNSDMVFTIIDHHKTTLEELSLNNSLPPEVLFDNNKSGCVLTYECIIDPDVFTQRPRIPKLLLYLQDRDLWQFKQKDSEIINEGLFKLLKFEYKDENTPEFTNWINYAQDNYFDQQYDAIYKLGSDSLEYKKNLLVALAKQASKAKFIINHESENETKYNIMLINTSQNISDIGNYLVQDSSIDFALIYRISSDDVWYSLRSSEGRILPDGTKKTFDTTTISKLFGGGGHMCASGFQTKFQQLNIFRNNEELIVKIIHINNQ